MAIRVKPKAKAAIIDSAVRSYLRLYSLEAYLGQVHCEEVVDAVRRILNDEWGARMTDSNRMEVFDALHDLGPSGEGDVAWLKLYCSECKWETVAGRLVPIIGASIDNWGQIA